MQLEKNVGRKLISQKKTIAIAESCTGGLLSHRLTNVPGSSTYFKFGLVAYCNEAKSNLLQVSNSAMKKFGAVSQPVAIAMAAQVRRIFDTDFGIGITGIAGPTGGSKLKPVGLTFIAVASRNKAVVTRSIFQGNRPAVKTKATSKALKMLLEFLS